MPTDWTSDLLRPAAYPAPRPSRVELITTHISWVFLLERDVYKVKRPVDLGFLNFGSIDQRRAACEAEVRLNARLSPEVYRGVVPVRRGEDGHACIGGSGPVIDWAVHMVRLDDERRADRLLVRGELGDARIESIARRIAAFHAGARVDAETSRFGTPEAIAHNVEENFAQTEAAALTYIRPEEHAEIMRAQRAFLRNRASVLEARAAAGRVRDGHGDLRLEHIYFGPMQEVAIVDCIEFNERFRFADVCADVAFLSMDLAAHGYADRAERLLAAYARAADDFDLYAVVDFYETYRAYVRAKISTIVAADPAAGGDARQRAREQARRYFLLALAQGRGSLLAPALVAVGGVIGAGKSTVAERLAAEMSAPVIDADRTRKAMLSVPATERLAEPAFRGAYAPALTERVYAELSRRASVVLASGRPVILDASFRSARMRAAVRELALSRGVPFRFVECRADAATCRARLAERERSGGVSDGRLELFDEFCARYEPVTELAPDEHVVLDTSAPVEANIEVLRERLGTWPSGLAG